MRIVSRVGIGKDPGSVHHLDVTGSVNFDDRLYVQNNVFLNANVDLGNTSADLISFNGRSVTSLEPNSTLSVNLGSSLLFWNNTYSKNLIIQNAGSIESNGNILNLGTIAASTINIGNTGTTVNIYGVFNKIQSTDTEVFDKLITLNKNGVLNSAVGSGIEIEENALISAYIKTSSDRNQWLFKSPNKSGIISLEAGNLSFTHKIISQATADRVWTLPDNTDTFVGTTNAQIIDNKTLNNTTTTGTFITNGTVTTNGNVTINGSITINGTASGRGFVPLGTVIATIPSITGTYSCTATTAADAFGYVRCNGQTIVDATSPLNNQVIPNINNDVFLKGNIAVTFGTFGGSNTHTHTVNNHTHTVPGHRHLWGNHWSNDNSTWNHPPYGDNWGNTYDDTHGYGLYVDVGGNGQHNHNIYDNETRQKIESSSNNNRTFSGRPAGDRSSDEGFHGHGATGRQHRHWLQERWTHTYSDRTHDGRYDFTSGGTAPGMNTVSSEPKFITVLYIMRIK